NPDCFCIPVKVFYFHSFQRISNNCLSIISLQSSTFVLKSIAFSSHLFLLPSTTAPIQIPPLPALHTIVYVSDTNTNIIKREIWTEAG
ncbi:MAG: hypothetical protein WAM14_18880, partial [Candidatus Nitrosopolaris sp.]